MRPEVRAAKDPRFLIGAGERVLVEESPYGRTGCG
jgi:hypothetical protein